MTLSLKIKHTGPDCYGASVLRAGQPVATLHPGQEAEVTLWDGAPLTVVEFARDPRESVAAPTNE